MSHPDPWNPQQVRNKSKSCTTNPRQIHNKSNKWSLGISSHAVFVCLSVCLFVTIVYSVKTNKHIFKILSESGSQAILVLSAPNVMAIFLMGPPTEASNAGGVDRNSDSEPISGFTACCQRCNRPVVINTTPPDHGPASCDTYRW